MGLIERLKTAFFAEDGRRVTSSFSWVNSLFGNDADFGEYGDTEKIVRESYGKNPYFFMIVDRIASIMATLPRELMSTETGKPEENPSKDASELRALLENPNNFETSYDFYYRLAANLLIGNLYIYKEAPAGFATGMPATLISPISSDVTINEPTAGGMAAQSYSFEFMNASFNSIEPDKILHLKRPNIVQSTLYGFPTTTPSAALYMTSNEIFKSGFALHKNKGIQGVLHGKGGTIMRPDEQKQLQEYYDRNFGNNSKTGKVKISSTELGYIPMGVNPADLQSVAMNLDLLRATCAMFGAPSQLFGDVAASTYSNMEQAEHAFYMTAVLPIARRIDQALNYWLLGGEENYQYKVNETQMSVVQDLKTDLIANAINLYSARLITIEEARLMVNEDFEIVPEELKAQTPNPQTNEEEG